MDVSYEIGRIDGTAEVLYRRAGADRQSATTLYLRNDTAQGAAATADFIIEFEDLR